MLSSPPMRYVWWVLAPLLFFFFITFAVKNTDAVAVRYFLGQEWRAPLIAVLLVFFVVGAVLGVLGMLGRLVRQRREIASLKRELEAAGERREGPPPAPDLAAR